MELVSFRAYKRPRTEYGDERVRRLITPATWKYLKKVYFFSRWFPFHPFVWDNECNAPKVVVSRIPLHRLHFVSSIVFYILLLYRCVEITVLQPGSPLEQIYVLFVASYFFIFILLQVQSAFWTEETVFGLQSLFLLIQKCEGYLHKYMA